MKVWCEGIELKKGARMSTRTGESRERPSERGLTSERVEILDGVSRVKFANTIRMARQPYAFLFDHQGGRAVGVESKQRMNERQEYGRA